jgi:hypothetical protein
MDTVQFEYHVFVDGVAREGVFSASRLSDEDELRRTIAEIEGLRLDGQVVDVDRNTQKIVVREQAVYG